jgi:glycolate oxidase FAD binding subunit
VTTHRPTDMKQLREIVAWAAAEAQPLELIGGGTKRGIGGPSQAAHTLDLAAFSGIRSYEANELVLVAGAGTPLVQIEKMLDEKEQMLAFEPPALGAGQTIGGVIASNLSGPRRLAAGAARDHFLGFAGVSGRGEIFKAGGKVVKNVTGYDLPKLMAGSWGTLAALEEIVVKVLPRPEKTRTVLLFGRDDASAVEALARALGSPHEVTAAAHLPAAAAARSAVAYVAGAGRAVTALRVEGFGPSVEHRCRALRELLHAEEELHGMNSRALWGEIATASLLPPDRAVWRVSVAPSAGPRFAAGVARALDAECLYDWGGGLVWLAVASDGDATSGGDAGAATIRATVRSVGGGHATLFRAPEALQAAVPGFEPPSALARRVKEAFDPKGILNPGRMGF